MKKPSKPGHSFVKRPSGKCVWCEKPRTAHEYEMVQTENGLQKVAIKEEAANASH